MTDREIIAIICNGWLSNKYASMTKSEDTAKEAFAIAKEILRFMKEDKNLMSRKLPKNWGMIKIGKELVDFGTMTKKQKPTLKAIKNP